MSSFVHPRLKEVLLVKVKRSIKGWNRCVVCYVQVVWILYQREGWPKVHLFVSGSCGGFWKIAYL